MSVLALCKFTPLGFETNLQKRSMDFLQRVNLPRWGLKLCLLIKAIKACRGVNLPRWGLKPNTVKQEVFFKIV